MRIYHQASHVNQNGLNGLGHIFDMNLLEVGEAGMTMNFRNRKEYSSSEYQF